MEVLLALVLLTVGALALASVTGAVTRMLATGALFTEESNVGSAVVDRLRPTACGAPLAGDSTTGAISLSWTTSGGPVADAIEVVVEVRRGDIDRTDTLRGLELCP